MGGGQADAVCTFRQQMLQRASYFLLKLLETNKLVVDQFTQVPAAPSDDLLQLQGNPFANMMNGECTVYDLEENGYSIHWFS